MTTTHGGNLEWAARRYGMPPSAFLDFSANLNPLGPPPSLAGLWAKAVASLTHYPDPEMTSLRALLGEFFGIPPETVVPGNGAASLLHHFLQFIRARRALLPSPCFGEYPQALEAARTPFDVLELRPETAFLPPSGRLVEAVTDHDLLLLARPNNPTGGLVTATELRRAALRLAKHGGILLADESFIPFLPGWREESLLTALDEGVVVLISLTKILALPGLRFGFMALRPDLAKAFLTFLPSWEVNGLAEALLPDLLTDREFWRKTALFTAEAREELAAGLRDLGLRVFPSSANFLLVDAAPHRGSELADSLGRRGLLIRWGLPGLGPGYIRVAVRRPDENALLLSELRRVLRGNSK